MRIFHAMLVATMVSFSAQAAGDPLANYYGNTVITYSRSGAVLAAHYYRDGKFLKERPTGMTEGIWSFNAKGEFCDHQIKPPRKPPEPCYPFDASRKPGEKWVCTVKGEVCHHKEMLVGDVFFAPSPKSDPMHGYYDNVMVVKGPDTLERRVYFNRDHSAVVKTAGKPDVWSEWELKDKATFCLWPFHGARADAVCESFVPNKDAGDTWTYASGGATYAAHMKKLRP